MVAISRVNHLKQVTFYDQVVVKSKKSKSFVLGLDMHPIPKLIFDMTQHMRFATWVLLIWSAWAEERMVHYLQQL